MLPRNIFVFDIETVPDIQSARKLYDLNTLDDHEVADYLFAKRRQEAGTEFMRHHLHQIVAISIVFKSADQLKVWSLGEEDSTEAEIIRRFFHGIDRYLPVLVSWNGAGFDLPVLHYRALLHRIQTSHYWEMGDKDPQFRWNNYINRFQFRHMDLMDILSAYQIRCAAPLDEMANLLGFPGKMGMAGNKVWETYRSGDLKSIRDYCETDVLNTYLLYLQFEYMRHSLTLAELEQSHEQLKQYLQNSDKLHLHQFLEVWNNA